MTTDTTHLINCNDVTDPIPAVHAAQIDDAVYNVRNEVDATKLDKATIKQLRKNIERLKTRSQIADMKRLSHYDIRAFFPLGKK